MIFQCQIFVFFLIKTKNTKQIQVYVCLSRREKKKSDLEKPFCKQPETPIDILKRRAKKNLNSFKKSRIIFIQSIRIHNSNDTRVDFFPDDWLFIIDDFITFN